MNSLELQLVERIRDLTDQIVKAEKNHLSTSHLYEQLEEILDEYIILKKA